jgi:hypothetical protein
LAALQGSMVMGTVLSFALGAWQANQVELLRHGLIVDMAQMPCVLLAWQMLSGATALTHLTQLQALTVSGPVLRTNKLFDRHLVWLLAQYPDPVHQHVLHGQYFSKRLSQTYTAGAALLPSRRLQAVHLPALSMHMLPG